MSDLVPKNMVIILQEATAEEITDGEYITVNWVKYSTNPSKIGLITDINKVE